ncbi:MAG: hypothetical protein GY803_21285 [Chloroflexi bacterium]|nr:hypothetical protein [Chloroflexota bacterium]
MQLKWLEWARNLQAIAHSPHPNHAYKLFFRCEIVSGEATTGLETEAVSFFHEGNLPDLCPSHNTPRQIGRMFAHYRHPHWPTDFD